MRRFVFALILLVSAPSIGCYWKYRNAAGDPFPQRITVEPIGGSAGVTVTPQSTQPSASSINKTSVVELLAERLVEEKVFDAVIFPWSPLTQTEPTVFLDATVHIQEKHYWGENITKAILTGLTFFLLGPVLATHYGVVVDLSVYATSSEKQHIGTYSYRSEYDFHYTTMTPRQDKMDEWLETAKQHAVEEVLNQLKQDRAMFLRHSKVARVSLGPNRVL